MLKFSNEQLTRLALHGAAINAVLTEALLSSQQAEALPSAQGNEVEIDVYVIGADREKSPERPPQAETPDLDHLCGEWKAGRRESLTIFKAAPGYMVALGKIPKKGTTGDCYLLHEQGGSLCFNAGFGVTFLAWDKQSDTLALYPGGEYTRVTTDKK